MAAKPGRAPFQLQEKQHLLPLLSAGKEEAENEGLQELCSLAISAEVIVWPWLREHGITGRMTCPGGLGRRGKKAADR